MLRPTSVLRLICYAALLNLVVVPVVGAQVVFYIGNDLAGGIHQDGCDFDNFQDGINYIFTHYPNGGSFEFHVRTDYAATRSGAINIPGDAHSRNIIIAGGYDHCPDPLPNPDAVTELDGFSGIGPPVLAISGHTSLTLTQLTIEEGNSSGNGGGIAYNNSGCTDDLPCVLSLRDVQVHDNTADQGGGIFVNGGGTTFLYLLDNTYIVANFSHHDGGGIFMQGNSRLFALHPQTTIFHNTADPANNGRGGGIWLQGNARADIGSPGYDALAVIDYNTAGGGIGVGDAAVVRLFTTVPSSPPRIEHNQGGGVLLASASSQNALCAFGYGINNNFGPAIFADSNTAGVFLLQSDLAPNASNAFLCGPEPASELGAVACPVGKPCNTIDNNDNRGTNGPVILASSYLNAEQVEMRGNKGRFLLHAANAGQPATLTNCLVAGNSTSQQLILSAPLLAIDSCTIADNDIGVVDVLYPIDEVSLQRSIVWQPTNETLRPTIHDHATLVDDIASDAAMLRAGPAFATFDNVQGSDPQFVDVATGNYQLEDSSPAIDYARSVAIAVDLNGQLRPRDLKGTEHPYDVGAFERQGLFPSYEPFDEFESLAQLGWSLDGFGDGSGWSLTSVSPESAPFAAYAPDPPNVSENDLTTPSFHVIANARLTFHHTFQLEAAYDAALLDITIDGKRQGIISAGGHFINGGYNGTLVRGGGDTPNPLGIGRSVWTGSILPSYQEVIVDLPAAANGKDVYLTWRVGSDINQGGAGYWLDDLSLDLARPPPDVIRIDGFDEVGE